MYIPKPPILLSALGPRRATAAVEFAIVAPFLALLLTGVWEMGAILEAYLAINNAAREGARQAACGTKTLDTVKNDVINSLKAKGLKTTNVSITLTNLTNPGSTDPASYSYCDHFQIKVTLPFQDVAWASVKRVTGITTITATSEWHSLKDFPLDDPMVIPTN